ncbi:cell division protein FtsL [Aquibacillus salsiterrae]|uniref:Cell division protein FtsL n=1 Tax=Aquibacillus salsiterrae TaxID=2950439 RepID=A0A9X4AE95_9BACI|nr:cell division protein FtsL [Aquibacillus salsiterrae]MDC3416486.1 cell division protein FtsL [Aquibacillus salsiterrae]
MATSEARNWQQSWQEQVTTRQVEPERKVKVNGQKRWITTGEKFIYSIVSVLTVVMLLFTVSYSISLDSLNRNVQQLEQDVEQQQVQNENLSYKVKEFSNPSRILRIAKENGLQIQNASVKQASQFTAN